MSRNSRLKSFFLCFFILILFGESWTDLAAHEFHSDSYTVRFSSTGNIERIDIPGVCEQKTCSPYVIYDRPDSTASSQQAYDFIREERATYSNFIFRAKSEDDGAFTRLYKIHHGSRLIEASINSPLTQENVFFPFPTQIEREQPSLRGLAGNYDKSVAVLLQDGTASPADPLPFLSAGKTLEVTGSNWFGLKNRFSYVVISPQSIALLVSDGNKSAYYEVSQARQSTLAFRLSFGRLSQQHTDTYPEQKFETMHYGNTWGIIKYLCGLFSKLLHKIHDWTGNWGLSIIVLAIVIRVFLTPLVIITDRLSDNYLKKMQVIAPLVEELKEKYKGETLHYKILALHKTHNIGALDSLKPLSGLALQVPVFIAVFNMLAGEFSLYHQPFLWIDDLSFADRYLSIAGRELNILPICMLLISILGGVMYAGKIENKGIKKNERLKLVAIAILFFVLLYSFPAAMVLYWTMVNVLQLVPEITRSLRTKS